MGTRKVHVFLVKRPHDEESVPRLIRGTLKDVEAYLRQEITIEPCTPEQAHGMSGTEIESAEGAEY